MDRPPSPPASGGSRTSLGEFARFLLGRDLSRCPGWHADVFGVSAGLLNRSGAYRLLAGRGLQLPADWKRDVIQVGNHWSEVLDVATDASLTSDAGCNATPPERVTAEWQVLVEGLDLPLVELGENPDMVRSLVTLCACADEAAGGVGISTPSRRSLRFAEDTVLPANRFESLCIEISVDKLRVLPKQHTPQRGLTIRSLSHNLALCPASEVTARWFRYSARSKTPDPFNLLLFPWPFLVQPLEFHTVSDERALGALPRAHRLFEYRREPKVNLLMSHLAAALAAAKKQVHELHGLVLPETALCDEELQHVERFCLDEGILLVTGVARPGLEAPRNVAYIQPAGLLGPSIRALKDPNVSIIVEQSKHHRWCLDSHQVTQYGLGRVLPAKRDSWEFIEIGRREITFVTICSWLTVCALVCEDLARQDPMPDVLRAVGPNLVFALLMDGPQLRSRWPSRYASVLAEDPGSSVLSLTSLGMSNLSRARAGEMDRSRVVALWRDAMLGERELELPAGFDAGVLSVSCHSSIEYTADGREDAGVSHFPVFSAFSPVQWTAQAV
jgi:hypothetical protein